MSESGAVVPRRRDAAATRVSLVNATRELLADQGASVTSRDIAAKAGVNQALINRYFGSKENLFVEAVRTHTSPATEMVATVPLEALSDSILREVLAASGPDGAMTSHLVGVVDSETVNEVIREAIEDTFTTTLGDRLDGPDAALRAELVNALVIGVSILRNRIGTRELATASIDDIAYYVRLMVAPILENPPRWNTASSTEG